MHKKIFPFGKAFRLSDSKAIRQVFGQNIKFKSHGVSLLARSNDSEYSRICIMISKKQIATAVQRNRVKRIIRETFRLSRNTMTGWDIVVMVYGNILNHKNIYKSFIRLWQKYYIFSQKQQ